LWGAQQQPAKDNPATLSPLHATSTVSTVWLQLISTSKRNCPLSKEKRSPSNSQRSASQGQNSQCRIEAKCLGINSVNQLISSLTPASKYASINHSNHQEKNQKTVELAKQRPIPVAGDSPFDKQHQAHPISSQSTVNRASTEIESEVTLWPRQPVEDSKLETLPFNNSPISSICWPTVKEVQSLGKMRNCW
jgi:hypothetical protein